MRLNGRAQVGSRAMRSPIKHTGDSSTGPEIVSVQVISAAEVVACVAVTIQRGRQPAPSHGRLKPSDLRDLTRLIAKTDSPDVGRAARALLKLGRGSTLKEAAAGTAYGIGWVRGLLEAFERDGISGIRDRDYRRPRSGGG